MKNLISASVLSLLMVLPVVGQHADTQDAAQSEAAQKSPAASEKGVVHFTDSNRAAKSFIPPVDRKFAERQRDLFEVTFRESEQESLEEAAAYRAEAAQKSPDADALKNLQTRLRIAVLKSFEAQTQLQEARLHLAELDLQNVKAKLERRKTLGKQIIDRRIEDLKAGSDLSWQMADRKTESNSAATPKVAQPAVKKVADAPTEELRNLLTAAITDVEQELKEVEIAQKTIIKNMKLGPAREKALEAETMRATRLKKLHKELTGQRADLELKELIEQKFGRPHPSARPVDGLGGAASEYQKHKLAPGLTATISLPDGEPRVGDDFRCRIVFLNESENEVVSLKVSLKIFTESLRIVGTSPRAEIHPAGESTNTLMISFDAVRRLSPGDNRSLEVTLKAVATSDSAPINLRIDNQGKSSYLSMIEIPSLRPDTDSASIAETSIDSDTAAEAAKPDMADASVTIAPGLIVTMRLPDGIGCVGEEFRLEVDLQNVSDAVLKSIDAKVLVPRDFCKVLGASPQAVLNSEGERRTQEVSFMSIQSIRPGELKTLVVKLRATAVTARTSIGLIVGHAEEKVAGAASIRIQILQKKGISQTDAGRAGFTSPLHLLNYLSEKLKAKDYLAVAHMLPEEEVLLEAGRLVVAARATRLARELGITFEPFAASLENVVDGQLLADPSIEAIRVLQNSVSSSGNLMSMILWVQQLEKSKGDPVQEKRMRQVAGVVKDPYQLLATLADEFDETTLKKPLEAWQESGRDLATEGDRCRVKNLGLEGKYAEMELKMTSAGWVISRFFANKPELVEPGAAVAAEPEFVKSEMAVPGQDTQKRLEGWLKDARALGEDAVEKRDAVIHDISETLQSDQHSLQIAALTALAQLGDVKFDKQRFRPRIIELCQSENAEVQRWAFYALLNNERQDGDLELLQEVMAEPVSGRLAESASHLLQSFDEGVIRGKSEEIVVRLLNSSDKSLRREALRGLWGAKYGEKITNRVIELVDNKESHHDAIYYALSTSPEKTPAAIDKLIEVLSDPDWNNWGRAIWGLGYGVPEDQQKKVAAAMLQMYELRSDPRTRGKCDRLIREYGDKEQISKLDEMAGSTVQTASDRAEQGTDEVETKVDDVLEGDEPRESELVEEEKVE